MNLTAYHFVSLFRNNVQQYPQKDALMGRDAASQWKGITWETLGNTTTLLSKALLSLGVQPQETVGILSQNTPQWSLADLACLQIRAITVPIYTTNTAEQALYVMNHAEIKVLFVSDETQYNKALEVAERCASLQKIVVFNEKVALKEAKYSIHWADFLALGATDKQNAVLEKRLAERNLDDLFTSIYTSGTTGQPKGVMLTYENLAFQMVGHSERLAVDDSDSSLCFLPLSHVFERAWTCFCLYKCVSVYYLSDTNKVREALAEVRPTLMCAVPRFYEKIFATVHDRADASSFVKRVLFKAAVKTGKRMIALKEANETMYWLSLLFDTGYINKRMAASIMGDCRELLAMLVSTVKTAKRNMQQ